MMEKTIELINITRSDVDDYEERIGKRKKAIKDDREYTLSSGLAGAAFVLLTVGMVACSILMA